MRMNGKKVVVTGAAGFIGSHLVDELLAQGAEVVAIDNLSTGKMENLTHPGLNLDFVNRVRGDINKKNYLKDAFEGAWYVFHQAALRSVPASVANPEPYYKTNIIGHDNVLKAALDAGVKKVVFASSSSVYGNQDTFPLKEDMMPKPISPYAISKAAGEHICNYYTEIYGLKTISLRYFNVYGPRQSLESRYAVVVPSFITKLLNNLQPTIYGDGTQSRDFSFVKDVARANIIAARSRMTGAVNISGHNSVSINNLCGSIMRLTGKLIFPVYDEERKGDVYRTDADTELSKKMGYEPKYTLREGLQETIDYFKEKQVRQ